MVKGPMPAETRRRTNAPTIPTTRLRARGRAGRVPPIPEFGITLQAAGKAWWAWAWKTSAACAWHVPDDLSVTLHRAHLEDLINGSAWQQDGRTTISTFLKLAMDLDRRLGLDPHSRQEKRWKIEQDADDKPKPLPKGEHAVTDIEAKRAERERIAQGG